MTAANTLYIAPAMTDQAGQCRIYSTPGKPRDTAALYRSNPEFFKEAGIMNSQGRVVCIEKAISWNDLKDMEPLMAGTVIRLDGQGRVI